MYTGPDIPFQETLKYFRRECCRIYLSYTAQQMKAYWNFRLHKTKISAEPCCANGKWSIIARSRNAVIVLRISYVMGTKTSNILSCFLLYIRVTHDIKFFLTGTPFFLHLFQTVVIIFFILLIYFHCRAAVIEPSSSVQSLFL